MVNNITIEGRLGREPEIRFTKNNAEVANFSLAVSRGKDKKPDWWRVISYEKGAIDMLRERFHKGYAIVVYGELRLNKYTDRDGNEREEAEIVAYKFGYSSIGTGERNDHKSDEPVAATAAEPRGEADDSGFTYQRFGFAEATDGELPF